MFVVIEQWSAAEPERKNIVVKSEVSTMDRDWLEHGRSTIVRLSDGKVATMINGKLYWRRNFAVATAVYHGSFVIAEKIARGTKHV